MKNARFFSILIVVVVMVLMLMPEVFAAGKDASRVGIFDMQRIIMESRAGQKARGTFQKELAERQQIFAKQDEQVRKAQQELMESEDLDAAQLKAKQRELAQETKELDRLRTDLEEEMKGMDEELTLEVLKDVVNVVKDIGDKENYSIIFQKTANMVYINNAVDVTTDILKSYDKLFKE